MHQILSRHLERVSRTPSPAGLFRAFVQSKDTNRRTYCGITYRREPEQELVQVQWFNLNPTTNGLELMGGLSQESSYDIYPHPQFKSIRLNSFATPSAHCTNPNFQFGVVRGIHRNGRVSRIRHVKEVKYLSNWTNHSRNLNTFSLLGLV